MLLPNHRNNFLLLHSNFVLEKVNKQCAIFYFRTITNVILTIDFQKNAKVLLKKTR